MRKRSDAWYDGFADGETSAINCCVCGKTYRGYAYQTEAEQEDYSDGWHAGWDSID